LWLLDKGLLKGEPFSVVTKAERDSDGRLRNNLLLRGFDRFDGLFIRDLLLFHLVCDKRRSNFEEK
jgi:hypothetical protein